VPNNLSAEGHTDAKPYTDKSSYSDQELSSDRANVARRLMQESGLHHNQVSEVGGFADRRLHYLKDPRDPSNRCISITVQYAGAQPAGAESAGDSKESEEEKSPAVGKKTESATAS
jgi:chemotaxis protein MotB